jgi:uncharacterized membrane protein YkvA (DUF1232 family)
MQACAIYADRAAILIVGWIDDLLVIQREVNLLRRL